MRVIVVGFLAIGAISDVIFNGSQLIRYTGPWSLTQLSSVFLVACSVVGLASAVGAWMTKRWGWWLGAWFATFYLLTAVAPSIIFRRWAVADPLSYAWIILSVFAIIYFSMPSIRAQYAIQERLWTASLKTCAAAFVCAIVVFGNTISFVLRAS